jgi:probable addiction module antidote protein
MNAGAVPYEPILLEKLKTDDEFAVEYLNECLQDDDQRIFLLALRRLVEARGIRMTHLAKNINMERAALYRCLSESGNPQWDTLSTVLSALGLKIQVSFDRQSA